jgi:hypothetical protein
MGGKAYKGIQEAITAPRRNTTEINLEKERGETQPTSERY